MRATTIITISGALVATALGGTASADQLTKDNWPLAVVDRPLLIPGGMLEIRGDTARINLSKDSAGDPIQLAPDVYYGVGKTLNVGIVHADSGICIAGDACDKAYNDIGIDALYGFMNEGTLLVAARGGVRIPSFDNLVSGLQVGIATQLGVGKIQVTVDPTLYVGVIGRTADDVGDAAQKETLSVPVLVWYQAQKQTAVFVRSGVAGALDGFGDNYVIPVGVGAVFAVNNRIDLGAEFTFTNLAGNENSADGRWLIARAALRL